MSELIGTYDPLHTNLIVDGVIVKGFGPEYGFSLDGHTLYVELSGLSPSKDILENSEGKHLGIFHDGDTHTFSVHYKVNHVQTCCAWKLSDVPVFLYKLSLKYLGRANG